MLPDLVTGKLPFENPDVPLGVNRDMLHDRKSVLIELSKALGELRLSHSICRISYIMEHYDTDIR